MRNRAFTLILLGTYAMPIACSGGGDAVPDPTDRDGGPTAPTPSITSPDCSLPNDEGLACEDNGVCVSHPCASMEPPTVAGGWPCPPCRRT